ncbi:MAG: MipA/OmpV family protein, partial [Pseudomonadota bacterium]
IWRRQMRAFTLLATFLFVFASTDIYAQAGDNRRLPGYQTDDRDQTESSWSYTLGVGVATYPTYEGSDETESDFIPLVDITYNDRWFASTDAGIGVHLIDDGLNYFGASYGTGYERYEDDDFRALAGLGDIEQGGALQLEYSRIVYHIAELSIIAVRDFGDSDATTIDLSIASGYGLSESQFIGVDLSASWADDNYMDSFFSVSQAAIDRRNSFRSEEQSLAELGRHSSQHVTSGMSS